MSDESRIKRRQIGEFTNHEACITDWMPLFVSFWTNLTGVCGSRWLPPTPGLSYVPPVFELVPWRTWRGKSLDKPQTFSAGWLWPLAARRVCQNPPGQRKAAPPCGTTRGPTWATEQDIQIRLFCWSTSTIIKSLIHPNDWYLVDFFLFCFFLVTIACLK